MPPKALTPPNQTVALCGIRFDVSKEEITTALSKVSRHFISTFPVSGLKNDKGDDSPDAQDRRKLVFLNCSSSDGAKQVCAALHLQKSDIGMEKYGGKLQAVIKTELSSLSWDELSLKQKQKQIVEGKISQKRKVDCLISEPMNIIVSRKILSDKWNQLKPGDLLRVEAEEGADGQPWQALHAELVDTKIERKAAEAKMLAEADSVISSVLVQNLRGKGWVPINHIGGWFNTTPAVKEALIIIKSKHKQLKNYVANCELLEVKNVNGEFQIALLEDLAKEQASLSKQELAQAQLRSMEARSAVQETNITTSDETKEEQEGRTRSYRIQRAILELVPQILAPVLKHAWQQRTNEAWAPGSGEKLLGRMKKPHESQKRIGKHGLEKVKGGQLAKFDITLYALLLLEDPGLLDSKSTAHKAVSALRSHRNEFVHELHTKPALDQEEFNKEWDRISKQLGELCGFVGTPEVRDLLAKESKAILEEGVNAQKEKQFAKEFEQLHSQLERLGDELDSVKKKMMTESRTNALFENKLNETMAKMAQQSASQDVTVNLDDGNSYSLSLTANSKLGGGAQGSVYKAQTTTGRAKTMIALKLVPQADGSMSDREYQNLKKIKHKNVVRFLGRGVLRNGPETFNVIGMAYIVGVSYDEYLKDHGTGLTWREVQSDFQQVVEGMKAVHAQGIVHRDLKPANLVRAGDGKMVIVDFGLSKDTRSSAQATVTAAGVMKGTPAYSAPEAGSSVQSTPAADVFSMGVILYEAISGELPWTGDNNSQTRSTVNQVDKADFNNLMMYRVNVLNKSPFPLNPDEAPPALNVFVTRCLKANPAERFQNAAQMLEEWTTAVEECKRYEAVAGSEAQTFWTQNFGDTVPEVTNEDFRALVEKHWKMPEAAARALVAEVDSDQNGSVEKEEFLRHFSKLSVSEIQSKYAAAAAALPSEPETVFFSKQLVLYDVRFTSKGTFMGGKKDRIGTLTLLGGEVVARRYDGAESIVVYTFKVDSSQITVATPSVDIAMAGEKVRKFTFKDAQDCAKFEAAFNATKAWQTSEG